MGGKGGPGRLTVNVDAEHSSSVVCEQSRQRSTDDFRSVDDRHDLSILPHSSSISQPNPFTLSHPLQNPL
jgi:hypothetical protein